MKLINGNCKEELQKLEAESVDAIITDPPYELGFMGKAWDGTGIANDVGLWKECLRVLKPGGYLMSFGGTRTYHRMAVAIEDAGFEVRDMIEWVYGSGFPKSLNIEKAINKIDGVEFESKPAEGVGFMKPDSEDWHQTKNMLTQKGESSNKAKEWEGWGTALKPAHEPICMARKPLSEKTVAENCLKYGTGGINIDESRVDYNEANTQGRFPANLIHDNGEEVRECFPSPHGAGVKRDTPSGVGNNYMGRGKDSGVRIGDSGNASRFFKSIIYQAKASKAERNRGCEGLEEKLGGSLEGGNDKRNGDKPQLKPTKNHHPTVKPIALMEYLIKMVSREGATILDPFMGSGTTGVACKKLGREFIGIELEPEYLKIAQARIETGDELYG